MLITLKEILKMAEDQNYAVGSFNTPNFEALLATLEAAEELQVPVIIAHAQSHESFSRLRDIGPAMTALAKSASVPVCVHLDHGEDLDYLQTALDLGFTSVMYDGSLLPYEENVANTKKVVEMAAACGAGVEAEIGVMKGRESGDSAGGSDPEAMYTDPELAKRFVEDTGINALAASFGTAHGLYTVKPKLDFARIARIRELTGLPLVMHGGSGVSPEDYRESIRQGIRKINYFSYMNKAGAEAVKAKLAEGDMTFFYEMARAAEAGMKADVLAAMKVFCGK